MFAKVWRLRAGFPLGYGNSNKKKSRPPPPPFSPKCYQFSIELSILNQTRVEITITANTLKEIMSAQSPERVVGVLALQGDFAEHVSSFGALGRPGWRAVEVRTPEELAQCAALVLPGGESTAQGLLAARQGLLAPLRAWVAEGRPVWGTCAGLVLLADRVAAASQKPGGQPSLSPAAPADPAGASAGLSITPTQQNATVLSDTASSLDISLTRNWFGSQRSSFEAPLELAPELAGSAAAPGLRAAGVFIRAPAVLEVGPRARAIAWVERPAGDVTGSSLFSESGAKAAEAGAAGGAPAASRRVVVAVRQGPALGTAFHPEISVSTAWHEYFLQEVAEPLLAAR